MNTLTNQKSVINPKYTMRFEQIPSGVIVFEFDEKIKNFIVTDVNVAACEIENKNEILNNGIIDFFPNAEKSGFLEMIDNVYRTGEPIIISPTYYMDDCFDYWREGSIYKLSSKKVVVTFNDITEKIKAENDLKKSLSEKEILLNELHHRVKNNLHIIISLMQMQSKNHFDMPQVREVFNQYESRIKAMALVHETIHQAKSFSEIDLSYYLKSLLGYWNESVSRPNVKFLLHSESVQLSSHQATTLGIILNEIISNSMKHAFPDGRKGKLSISISKPSDNFCEINVVDDGIGVISISEESKGNVLKLIFGLVAQIKGEIQVETNPSFKYQMKIPVFQNQQ